MTSAAHRVQVGTELRRAREQLGLSGVQVAKELGWSQSKVSRIEAGRLGTSLSDLSALLTYYGLPEEVRAELLSVAVAGDGLAGAWIVKAGGPQRRQGEVAAIEARVGRIRHYAALTVPGLLQSEEYTREVARAAGFLNVEEIVARRAERQELLNRPNAVQYVVVLDERALLRTPGGDGVRMTQVLRLIEAAHLPSVKLYVLRAGSGARRLGMVPFLLYDFKDPGTPGVVQLESHTADTYLSDPSDLMVYTQLFDDLVDEALPPDESGDYLRSMHEASIPT